MYAPANDMNYERDLLNYAAVYAGYVFREYPVSRRSRRVLRQLQQNSNLQDTDITAIEAKVYEYKAYLEVASKEKDKDNLLPALRWIVVEHLRSAHPSTPPSPEPAAPPASPLWLQATVYTTAGMVICMAVAAVFWLKNPDSNSSPPPVKSVVPSLPAAPATSVTPAQPTPPASLSPIDTVSALRQHCNENHIDYDFLLQLAENPLIADVAASDTLKTEPLRSQNASKLLERLENAIDRTILPNLGRYTKVQAQQQNQRMIELGQPMDKIHQEADRRFQALFPKWQKGDNIRSTGLDQVWFALVDEVLKEREAGRQEPEVRSQPSAVSHR